MPSQFGGHVNNTNSTQFLKVSSASFKYLDLLQVASNFLVTVLTIAKISQTKTL